MEDKEITQDLHEEEIHEEVIEEKIDPPKSNIINIGLDCGTMSLVMARSDTNTIKSIRNMFLKLNEDDIDISELSEMNYIRNNDGELFIIGDDAFRFANIFNTEVSRPMQKGLISSKEVNAMDVLAMMIRSLIGEDLKEKEVYCSYSIPAEAIDENRSVIYHERVFGKILGSMGINHKPVNEAMAIIYSECSREKFSGISISLGGGMCNTCLSFKGLEAVKFSTARSGDYIDKQVADSLNMIPNRVTYIKESHLDLSDIRQPNPKKQTERVLEALRFYYENLVDYTIKRMVHEFQEKVDIEIEDAIPLVISGGTSLPKGFIELFESVFKKYDFPIKISEIRRAKNPLTAVAQGLLIKTMADFNKK